MIEFAGLFLAAVLGTGVTGVGVWFLFFRSAAAARKQQVKALEKVLDIKDAEIERLTRLSVAPVAADVEASIKLINQYASDKTRLAQELEEYKNGVGSEKERACFLRGLSAGLGEGAAAAMVILHKWFGGTNLFLFTSPPPSQVIRDLTETVTDLMVQYDAARAGQFTMPRSTVKLLEIGTKDLKTSPLPTGT
jgi:hypothetical protein